MEDVRDTKTFARAQVGDLAQHERNLGARNHAVLDVVVRTDAAHRGKRALAPLPHQLTFAFVARRSNLERSARARDLDGLRRRVFGFRLDPIDVDQQRSADVERPIDAGRLHDRLDRQFVHHLDRGRDDAGGDDTRDAIPGFVGRREGREQRARLLGRAQNSYDGLGDDADEAFAADERRHQVVADGVGARRTDLDHVTVRRYDRRGIHVIGREAIFQAVRAA